MPTDKTTKSTTLQFVYGNPNPTAPTSTTYSVGWHTEQGTVLGATFAGAYGGIGRTNTAYVTRSQHQQLGKWQLRYNAVLGASTNNGASGRSVHDISGVLSSSFSMLAKRPTKTGTLGFAIHQPLRVERGDMTVGFVSEVTANTQLTYDTKTVGITPSGRQVSVEAYYDFKNSPFAVKTHISKDKHHIKGNDDTTVMVRYFKPF